MRRYKQNAIEDFVEPTINLTALIDVVFVVLIIFIVIAPLLDRDEVNLADSESQYKSCFSTDECGPIAIHVKSDDKIFVNGTLVTVVQLEQTLKELYQRFPETRPQLFHDRNATFGIYQSIKNAAEKAEFKQMDVILKS